MENIVLIGFMGTGKSVVGRELAGQLGWRFIDIDREVEEKAGITISQIFERYGEDYFRQLEADTIRKVMAANKQVIATGGGAVLSADNRECMRARGIIVCLEATAQIILERIGKENHRPLLRNGDPWKRICQLKEQRETYYQKADYTIDTASLTPKAVAQKIIEFIGWHDANARLQLVRVNLSVKGYNIYIRPGILSSLPEYLPYGLGTDILLVSDENVSGIYGANLVSLLEDSGYRVHLFSVAEGETAKSLSNVKRLYEEALAAQIDRHSAIIALGGGVIGDLAGFGAATFMRGVPFLQVPTTLLAQVDSSVGGKVGINLPQGKNLVGAFYQPAGVFIDPASLISLPISELRAGMGEVIKYALVFSEDFLIYLEENLPAIMELDQKVMGQIIKKCCELKATVIQADEREQGKRMLLNFGHTIGHALESATGYGRLRHGEAVAIGMLAACRLSARLGLAREEIWQRLQALLVRIGLPTSFSGVKIEMIQNNFMYDKKVRGKKIPFILLRHIGQPLIEDDIDGDIIKDVLAELQK
ncbi:MAG: 3-dehydroquinate synthase [bacterium]